MPRPGRCGIIGCQGTETNWPPIQKECLPRLGGATLAWSSTISGEAHCRCQVKSQCTFPDLGLRSDNACPPPCGRMPSQVHGVSEKCCQQLRRPDQSEVVVLCRSFFRSTGTVTPQGEGSSMGLVLASANESNSWTRLLVYAIGQCSAYPEKT